MIFIHDVDDNILNYDKFYLSVIGSRSITDRDFVFKNIKIVIKNIKKYYHKSDNNIVIVSGGAKGVDTFGEEFADKFGNEKIIIKPDWNKFGKSAGFKRNYNIVRISNFVLAFVKNNSNGTLNSLSHANKLNILSYKINVS